MKSYMNLYILEKKDLKTGPIEKLMEKSLTHKYDSNHVKSGYNEIEMKYDGYTIIMDFYYKEKHMCQWHHDINSSYIEYFSTDVESMYFTCKVIYSITKKGYKLNKVNYYSPEDGSPEMFNWLDFVYVEEKNFSLFKYPTIKKLLDDIDLEYTNINFTSEFIEMPLEEIKIALDVQYEPSEQTVESAEFYLMINGDESVNYSFEKVLHLAHVYNHTFHNQYKVQGKMIIHEILNAIPVESEEEDMIRKCFVIIYLYEMYRYFNRDDLSYIFDDLSEDIKLYFLDFYTEHYNVVEKVYEDVDKLLNY